MSSFFTHRILVPDAQVTTPPELIRLFDTDRPAFLSLPTAMELQQIEALAKAWQKQARHLIVLGAGGSGLSGKALAALNPYSRYQLHVLDNGDLDSVEQVKRLDPSQCAVLVISKSGTTLEIMAYLDLVLCWLKQAEDWQQRIAVITQLNANILHRFAIENRLACLDHAADLCGRMSILSSVGLLPAAFMEIDIHALLKGAKTAMASLQQAAQAAVWQAQLLAQGKPIHTLMIYGPRFEGLGQWWRQLLAESLGKDGKGFTPSLATGTRDQHSQLQLYLDGPKDKLFTVMTEQTSGRGEMFSQSALQEQLKGRALGDVIAAQQQATVTTLANRQLPLRHIECPRMNEAAAGELLMQWMLEIAMLAKLMGVNAYNQPAVEESKRLTAEYLKA